MPPFFVFMNKKKELTNDDRYVIYKMLNSNRHKQEIAEVVGCHISTIYREIKRGLVKQLTTDYRIKTIYDPYTANERSIINKSKRGVSLKLIIGCDYLKFVSEKIKKEKYSPRAIVLYLQQNKLFDETLSDFSIYRYIRLGLIDGVTKKNLHYKVVKNRYIRHKRKRPPSGESIEKRPIEILNRLDFGHWEMDTVVGKQGISKKSMLVLTERKTRYELIFLLEQHTTQNVIDKINILEKVLKSKFNKIFKTITVDNGTEFSDSVGIVKSINKKDKRFNLYFCHPYSSYERGSNENANKLIRYHIPKGTNFDNKSDKDIREIQNWINEYPRKLFNGYNAKSKLITELKKLNIDYNTISIIF